jgi:hypothetical protein
MVYVTNFQKKANGSLLYDYSGNAVSSVITDSNPGPGNCSHVQYPLVSYSQTLDSDPRVKAQVSNLPLDIGAVVNLALNGAGPTLSWEKLPTSTQSGLLQLIAEIDDTIAMFSLKFLRSMTYGSFTWGILPFISEIKALLQALENAQKSWDIVEYRDSGAISWNGDFKLTSWSSFNIHATSISGKWSVSGKADMSFQNPLAKFLDFIGLHPDLATAWDLVPLSFVIDWILPIGDFLSQFRQGGWIKTVYFTGWSSYHINSISLKGVKGIGWTPSGFTSKGGRYYGRSQTPLVLIPPEVNMRPLDPNLPSPREAFNMFYLALSGRRF